MTLNEMIKEKTNRISNDAAPNTFKNLLTKVRENELLKFYSVEDVGDSMYHEMREIADYSAEEIIRGFNYYKITSREYTGHTGLDKLIFERILKDAEEEHHDELLRAIAEIG